MSSSGLARIVARLRQSWGLTATLTFSMGLVITVLMTVTAVLEIRDVRRNANEQLGSEGVNLADALSEIMANALYFSDVDELRDLIHLVSSQPNIEYVRVFESGGRLVADSEESDYPIRENGDAPIDLLSALAHEVRATTGEAVEVGGPIRIGRDVVGGVLIGMNTRSVDSQVSANIRHEIWEALAIIVTGVAMSFLLGRRIAGPLKRLVVSARQVAAGEFKPPGLDGRRGEIGELAAAFDVMTRALTSSYQDLEDRVEQRTSDLRTSEEKSRLLAHKLVEVQESERRSTARELHDEIGQQLTGLKYALGVIRNRTDGATLDELDKAELLLSGLISSVRDLSLRLRPSILDDFGLLAALKWLTNWYSTQGGVQATLTHSGLGRALAPEVEIAAYRIVQEGLSNVGRHAATDRAEVSAAADQGRLTIVIEDDGAGFDPDAPASGAGLSGIDERVQSLQGSLHIDSAPGEGTRLRIELPLTEAGSLERGRSPAASARG